MNSGICKKLNERIKNSAIKNSVIAAINKNKIPLFNHFFGDFSISENAISITGHGVTHQINQRMMAVMIMSIHIGVF